MNNIFFGVFHTFIKNLNKYYLYDRFLNITSSMVGRMFLKVSTVFKWVRSKSSNNASKVFKVWTLIYIFLNIFKFFAELQKLTVLSGSFKLVIKNCKYFSYLVFISFAVSSTRKLISAIPFSLSLTGACGSVF